MIRLLMTVGFALVTTQASRASSGAEVLRRWRGHSC